MVNEIDHYNIIISGKVQGVGFRYSCKKNAISFGVKGFVKNLDNGNVYVEAEATTIILNLFIKWCNEGPSHARVSNVSYNRGPIKSFKYFDITK